MMKIARIGTLGLLFAVCLHATPADAQSLETYVSNAGSDLSNRSCDLKNPCRTFAQAQFATRSGGVITCLTSGDFSDELSQGELPIMKSITIDCSGQVATVAFVTMNGRPCRGCFFDGDVPFPDGPTFVVILRGLTIGGIKFTMGSALHIENSTIIGAVGGGIHFAPEAESRLFLTDSVIRGNSNAIANPAITGGGILIKPTGSGSARVILTRVQALQSVIGISADGTVSSGGTSGIAMTITDSVVGGNLQDGILAITNPGQAPIRVTLDRTRSLNNDANGIRAVGPNLTVRVSNSVVSGNTTGLSVSSGAALMTSGNNVVEGNATNGAFSGKFALK
jgi:hypothetical protein